LRECVQQLKLFIIAVFDIIKLFDAQDYFFRERQCKLWRFQQHNIGV
jgi:hypothetical protein